MQTYLECKPCYAECYNLRGWTLLGFVEFLFIRVVHVTTYIVYNQDYEK